ncbi:WSC-domain-containing protein [Aulographum hederae CBS 113979]|uniref:WSC-domain-containing protein n=1 Tax=Aulographum hederae CBS 113979 TaxID=1176131 RepID=A0A6G1GR77_9PEZI|nr:WSC-domain-containing protein [Aulographum hederae CBS 113979]
MLFNSSPLRVVTLLALSGDAYAFFRIGCSRILDGRVDSIISPGKVSGHVHTLVGSANIGVSSTYDTLVNSECTSCEIQDDRSAYWSPQLYYQYGNGSVMEVPHDGSVLYYIARGAGQTPMTAFPEGLKMLSGDAAARSYDNKTMTFNNKTFGGRPVADRISWACLSTKPARETPGFSNFICPYGLRAQVHFQSCWDGVNLYKSDQSHVAYLSQIDNGVCPPTYPVLLPHLFIETSYATKNVAVEPNGFYTLAQGDPTGYGYHADFQNGWKPGVLQDAIDECFIADSSGDVGTCAPLNVSQISNTAYQCPRRPQVIAENVYGLLPKLPGCNQISWGPARAPTTNNTCPTSVAVPAILPTADTKPIATQIPTISSAFGNTGWRYKGCYNDTGNARALSVYNQQNVADLTIEKCQRTCQGRGMKFSGVELGNQCWCDNYIMNNARAIGEGRANCNFKCSGDSTENCGGAAQLSIFENVLAVTPAPVVVQSLSGKYLYKGCQKEGTSSRALTGAKQAADTMTVDACAKICLGLKFRWMGVEYGRECYCGNSLNSGGTAPATECNMRCMGNTNKTAMYCGGSSRLNVYYSSSL